ncbi:MAG: CoB--CoM heterodisulfide reductase iron-sulfur subunit B family protein, partial [Promethearchaeota archaeon]
MGQKFFLGCVIPARYPFLEASARKMFSKLGVEVEDVEGASCCPDPTGLEAIDHKSWLALGARNLALYEEDGSDVLSLCNGCTETLKWVQHDLNSNPEEKEEINEMLRKVGREYRGTSQIRHFTQVIHERIKSLKGKVEKPLDGFKVAVHYGCHFLRPSAIMQTDDPLDPTMMDEVVDTIGAESIDYGLKLECCGNPLGKSDEELSYSILKDKLDSIAETEANCVVVGCPACYQQFDYGQRAVNKKHGTSYSYPVFYLSELVALALGFSFDELGLKFHRNSLKPLLTATGFL